jgi:predicted nucleotidyltransferase
MPFGISEESFTRIVTVFDAFPKITQVRLFGSRALGRHRPGSDIDLALEGNSLTLNNLLELRLKLDNLMLPYRFDAVVLDDQISAELRDHIERFGTVIYQKHP